MAIKKGKASFSLLGTAKINDYTFDMDIVSDSKWQYSNFNLGVDCGSNGVIYAEMSGGFSQINDNLVYVHGKKENDNGKMVDDYKNQFTLDWDDRFDEKYLEDVGERSFIKVGIEKDKDGKNFTKKFLSEYDAIAYLDEHLEDGMVVRVNGNIAYQPYNGNIYTKKQITSIYASNAESDTFGATFEQTMFTTYDSKLEKKSDGSGFQLRAYVADYVGKYNGQKVKDTFTMPKTFEFELKDESKKDAITKKIIKSKKKSVVAEVSFEGIITKGGNEVNITIDDIPDDIKELIELGIYTEEEALQKCVGNKKGGSESFVIQRPTVKITGKGDDTKRVLEVYLEKYKSEDLNMFNFEKFGDVDQTEEVEEESGVDLDDLDDIFDMED